MSLPACKLSYITEHAHSFGFTDPSWSELSAWKSISGADVNLWDLSAIRSVIRSYQSARIEFDNTAAPMPAIGDIDQNAVADQVRAAMRG